jgi:hypothetical protein
MIITKPTLAILKNFASISPNLLIAPGSIIKTKSIQNTIYAAATVIDSFPSEFGIYDLPEFLSVISIFNNPDLEFNDTFVRITEGRTSIKYFSADKSVLTYPQKEIEFPEADISFTLSSDTLASINKTASILRVPDISFVGEDNKLKLVVSDKKNSTSNAFELDMGETDKEFVIKFKVDMFKFMPHTYTVDVSPRKVARFTAKEQNLLYFVGIESDSTFN